MKRMCIQTIVTGFLVGVLSLGSLFIPLANGNAKEIANDFTTVAREAMPAVVSIRVKASQSPMLNLNLWGQNEEFDNPNQDLFKFFFGVPRGRKEPLDKSPTIAQASGFIVSPDGYVMTNSHVVKEAAELTVITSDGREYSAQVVGADPNTDVALIKIDGKDLPFLKFGNSDDLQVGQWVVAIGNPLGLQASLTVGVVSAKGRNDLDLARVEDFIQTDAAINRGNSGGPLLNLDAQVVGMNTAIVSNSLNGGYMGIGFAIPSNIANYIKETLMADGTVSRGFLGVVLQSVDANLAKAFGLERAEGTLVAEVQANSPAEKAGIKQGDIILKFNEKPVTSGAALRTSISLLKPGSKATIMALRDGKPHQFNVAIGTFPDEKALVADSTGSLGFTVENLSPEMASQLGYQGPGVVIARIDPNSIAALAGLKKGAIIVEVNKKKVSTVDQFNQELRNNPADKPVLFLIKQGEITRFVSIKVG